MLFREFLERLAANSERLLNKRSSSLIHQQIERDERCRRLRGEFGDSCGRRMNALEQRVERESRSFGNDDLAVENEPRRPQRQKCLDQFRKVSGQRLAGLRLKVNLCAIAEDETAEA